MTAIALGYDLVHSTLDPPVTVVQDEHVDHAAMIAAGGVAGLTVAGLSFPEDGQEFDVADAEKALGRPISFEDWENFVARAVVLLSDEPHRARLQAATRLLLTLGEVSAKDLT